MKIIKKKWGHEEIHISNELYCFKSLVFEAGHISSLHYHKNKDETFILIYGDIWVQIENNLIHLEKDKPFRLKPNTKHRIIAITDSCIFEISSHDEAKDSYRLVKSS